MAFTDAQKRDIRKYLGVPFGFYTFTSRLESMMNLVGDNATDKAEIDGWLTELAALDAAIATAASGSASSATYGALKKADEVEFYSPKDSVGAVTTSISATERGRTLIARLARAFGVSDCLPICDYFSRASSAGAPIQLG